MHRFLLFGCRCVIPINLKVGMRGVSRREGEEAFLWPQDNDGDGPPGLSEVIWFYVRREV